MLRITFIALAALAAVTPLRRACRPAVAMSAAVEAEGAAEAVFLLRVSEITDVVAKGHWSGTSSPAGRVLIDGEPNTASDAPTNVCFWTTADNDEFWPAMSPHLKAEQMAAPTNAANVNKALANSEPSTHGP